MNFPTARSPSKVLTPAPIAVASQPAPPAAKPEFTLKKDYKNIRELVRLLNREICFIDTETTGIICPQTPQVALVELACLSFRTDGTVRQYSTLVNPGEIPIHWAAAKTHGISKKQVAGLATFETTVPALNYLAKNAIVSGFNTRQFDVPVLQQNYARYKVGTFNPSSQLDIRDVWIEINNGKNNGTLQAVADKYGVVPDGAHRALADVVTTMNILEEMISRHGMAMILSVYDKKSAKVNMQVATNGAQDKVIRAKVAKDVLDTPKAAVEPKPRNTLLAEAGQYILDFVKKNGRVLPSDYAGIAAAVERTPQQVASKVSSYFESGVLNIHQVEDVAIQKLIASHIDSAIEILGSQKLTPLKEFLDPKLGVAVDYLQLKIAVVHRQMRLTEARAPIEEEEEVALRP